VAQGTNLVDQVTAEMKVAMKARDKERTSALRMIRAAFIDAAKEGKGEVTDDRAITILRKLKKQRVEAAEQYAAGGREDLAVKERAEAELIDGFLPKLADEAQTRIWVEEAVAASGAASMKEMGKAMGALMRVHKADVDGGLARRILGEVLGG